MYPRNKSTLSWFAVLPDELSTFVQFDLMDSAGIGSFYCANCKHVVRTTLPNILRLKSLITRQLTFGNDKKIVDWMILMLWNCENVWSGIHLQTHLKWQR